MSKKQKRFCVICGLFVGCLLTGWAETKAIVLEYTTGRKITVLSAQVVGDFLEVEAPPQGKFRIHKSLLSTATRKQYFDTPAIAIPSLRAKSAPNVVPAVVLPASIPDLQTWIERHLLEKIGSTIGATQLPSRVEIPGRSDVNAWWCDRQYEAVRDNRSALYRLIREHLALARQLSDGVTEMERRQGLGVMVQMARGASNWLHDPPLAMAICEGWVLPHLEVATGRSTEWLSKNSVLDQVVFVYTVAKDETRLAKTYQLLLAHAPNRNTADAARFRLAQLAEKQGHHEQALEYLRGIDHENTNGMYAARSLIPAIEKKLENQPSGESKPKP